MLEQESNIEQRDSDQLPSMSEYSTTLTEPEVPESIEVPLIKQEVVDFLALAIHRILPKGEKVPSVDIHDPLEIYYKEEDETFWIRCCAGCIPAPNKKEAIKLMAHLGVTEENSELSDTICLSCILDMYAPPEVETEEIQANTADLAADVQK